jgi:N-methylhydantoinase B
MTTYAVKPDVRLRDLPEDAFAERYDCDRFTATVLSSRFNYITEHMCSALLRTAFSPIIRDWYDFGATLVGPRSSDYLTPAISNTLVFFTGTMMDAVRNTVEEYGIDKLNPGDILICNDPYRAGTHVNDLLFVMPVFVGGEIISFVNLRAHQFDMGGTVPGGFSGTKSNIYEDGLVVPPMALYREGVPSREAFTLLLNNIRFGNIIEPDLKNIVAALRLGASVVEETVQRYGLEAYLGAMRYTCDASEERMEAALESLPDGVYEGEDLVDADGKDDTEEYVIRVRITKRGARAEVDVSGTSRQARTSINATVLDAKSTVLVALKFLFDPRGEFTSGAMRPVDLVIPNGSVLSALPPDGAVFLYFEPTNALLSAILRAFAPVLGTKAMAGDMGGNNIHNAAGRRDDGSPWLSGAQVGGEHGPWGATSRGDGENYMVTLQANGLDPAIEAIEADVPVVVMRKESVIDTGGAGINRGGSGQLRDSLWLTEAVHHSMGLRFKQASGFGVQGGRDGLTGGVWLWDGRADSPHQLPLNGGVYENAVAVAGFLDPVSQAPSRDGAYTYFASQSSWPTKRMASFRYITNAGGGWGDPRERDPQRVLVDVRDGYVSVAAARRDYGVAVLGDPEFDPERLTIDVAETERLRSSARAR